jgi:hypothetical protein
MAEYIDRQAALDALCDGTFEDAEISIRSIPAADVATVVRCRDCVYKSQIGKSVLFCTIFERNMTPDDFCSMGARMDGMNEV